MIAALLLKLVPFLALLGGLCWIARTMLPPKGWIQNDVHSWSRIGRAPVSVLRLTDEQNSTRWYLVINNKRQEHDCWWYNSCFVTPTALAQLGDRIAEQRCR